MADECKKIQQDEQFQSYTEQPPITVAVTKPETSEKPPPHFLCIVFVSGLFCLPIAGVALQYSKESKAAGETGDFTTARRKGRTALVLALAAIVIGSGIVAGIVVWRLNAGV